MSFYILCPSSPLNTLFCSFGRFHLSHLLRGEGQRGQTHARSRKLGKEFFNRLDSYMVRAIFSLRKHRQAICEGTTAAQQTLELIVTETFSNMISHALFLFTK